tara:strand:+ start:17 stop:400 length:384 start_codon:yes stop_codon:yes gene_type:complete
VSDKPAAAQSKDPAFANRASLDCTEAADAQRVASRPADGGIKVISATYGGNCQAPDGNATKDLDLQCGGSSSCTYKINVVRLKDPASGCAKDYRYEYMCGNSSEPIKGFVKEEAGLGSYAVLQCKSD